MSFFVVYSPLRSFFRLNHLRIVRKRFCHSTFSSQTIIKWFFYQNVASCFSVAMGDYRFLWLRKATTKPWTSTGTPHKASLLVCLKFKEMYGRILKGLNIVNLYRGMSKLKLKINVNLLQLLCIVVSVALHGEFERFCGFCIDCYFSL